jgi:hypothetical protein
MLHQILRMLMGNWQIALGVVGLLAMSHSLTYCKGRNDGAALERAKQAQVETKAVAKAREADSAANTAVKETTNAVEESNQRARDASAGSPDPLGDALRSLRRETRPDPSAR